MARALGKHCPGNYFRSRAWFSVPQPPAFCLNPAQSMKKDFPQPRLWCNNGGPRIALANFKS